MLAPALSLLVALSPLATTAGAKPAAKTANPATRAPVAVEFVIDVSAGMVKPEPHIPMLLQKLHEVLLTAAAYRRRYDGARGSAVSRFVSEIPDALLEREEAAGTWSDVHGGRTSGNGDRRTTTWRRAGGGGVGLEHDAGNDHDDEPMVIPRVNGGRGANARRAVGQRVMHETFGAGTVLEADGDGPDMKLTVRFTGAIKKVLARFVTGVGDGD